MVRMFVRHPVRDFDAWKVVYDGFDEERREKGGVRGDAVFRSADHPNEVTVWHDFDDLYQARNFALWGRLAEVMEKGGLVGEPEIWFAEKV